MTDNTQELINHYTRDDPSRCSCPVCTRTKRFAQIVNKLEGTDDQKWMLKILDDLIMAEEGLSFEQDCHDHLIEKINRMSDARLP